MGSNVAHPVVSCCFGQFRVKTLRIGFSTFGAVESQPRSALVDVPERPVTDATPPTYTTTCKPGDDRPTHPDFKAPEFTHWGNVTPFLLHTGRQFRG
jgi:hypothetical protein